MRRAVLIVLAVVASGCGSAPTSTAPAPTRCHYGRAADGAILPDRACTPGATNPAALADPAGTVCVPGYTRTIRPPVSYTGPLKLKLMAKYGSTGPASAYELDHLVALEDGGNPTDPRNLWPEPLRGPGGAHAKDRVENVLHREVCSGVLAIARAVARLEGDWKR